MIGAVLRRLAFRRSATRAARLEAMRAQLETRLAERREGRAERNARSRKGAASKIHSARESDAVLNHRPAVADMREWSIHTEAALAARRARRILSNWRAA